MRELHVRGDRLEAHRVDRLARRHSPAGRARPADSRRPRSSRSAARTSARRRRCRAGRRPASQRTLRGHDGVDVPSPPGGRGHKTPPRARVIRSRDRKTRTNSNSCEKRSRFVAEPREFVQPVTFRVWPCCSKNANRQVGNWARYRRSRHDGHETKPVVGAVPWPGSTLRRTHLVRGLERRSDRYHCKWRARRTGRGIRPRPTCSTASSASAIRDSGIRPSAISARWSSKAGRS